MVSRSTSRSSWIWLTDMSLSVSLPLDGPFLRRECPRCERQFKWHHGSTVDRPEDAVDPPVYYCPYCGEPSLADEWWTQEQSAFIQQSSLGPAMREIADAVQHSFGNQRRSLIQVAMEFEDPELPNSLVEVADMVEIQSPCHSWEPIKIHDSWTHPIHCLLCGERFALS